MAPSPNPEDILLRYLLNQLEPPEREEIDTRLIADAEYSAQFAQAQYDLVDAYAAGKLSPEKLALVNQAIAANATFALAARMALAFRQARSHPARRPSPVPSRNPAWAIAACALLVGAGIVAAVAWHRGLVPRPQPGTPISAAVHNPPPVPEPPKSQTPAASASPAPKSLPATQPAAQLAMLVLPESTRDSAPIPLRLSGRARRIEVQWPVSSEAASTPELELQILRDAGRIVRSPERQPRQTFSGTPVACFLLPATLTSGEYLFRIEPAGAAPSSAPLAESHVRVTRP